MTFPKFFAARQRFDATCLDDPQGSVRAAVRSLDLTQRVRPGATVAITAGSRGITKIVDVLRACVDCLRDEFRAEPFLIPAMGSHGGATADSQQAVLTGYGITAEACGCPIRSSLDTVIVDRTSDGVPVHLDRHAWEADHILLVNRIKPHTDFHGPIQSGLVKMMLLGLGKYNGARIYHRAIQDLGFPHVTQSVGRRLLEGPRVLGGIALIENAHKQLANIEGVAAQDIFEREPALLREATQRMAQLPVPEADLLLIDRIGKNVSGTGMDTNVVGRKWHDHGAAEDEWPKINKIAVRGLTPETHGNATGIGIAEFCLQRVVQRMDRRATAINCLTSGHVTAGMLPLCFDTDQQLLEAALQTIGMRDPEQARVLWIHDTNELQTLACSQAYWDHVASREDVEIRSPCQALPIDAAGMLSELRTWLATL